MFTTLKLLKILFAAGIIFFAGFMAGCTDDAASKPDEDTVFLNVSYDPTRELYADYDEKFKVHWEKNLGHAKVNLTRSHGGSGKQARSVIDGNLDADVVTLALAYDVIDIKNAGLIRGGWQNEFPDNSSPYTSTIVFLVRKGNPKKIADWNNLVRNDVDIVMPNPKTSGGAQWGYLAAWEYATQEFDGNEDLVKDFMRKVFLNVVALDSGARGSTLSFVHDGKGDVLIAWENEALLSIKDYPDAYEIVMPSISILAEPTVAVVDKIVDEKGTRELATEYLNYLYSDEGQEIAAQNFYRPRNRKILAKYEHIFKPIKLFTVDEAFGGWVTAHNEHFADDATFDQVTEGLSW